LNSGNEVAPLRDFEPIAVHAMHKTKQNIADVEEIPLPIGRLNWKCSRSTGDVVSVAVSKNLSFLHSIISKAVDHNIAAMSHKPERI